MTNAEWLRATPCLPVDTAIKAAEAWWRDSACARPDMTPAARMAAWLCAERRETEEEQAEATVVTTIAITHIVRGITAGQARERGLDQWIADNARAAVWAGYHEHVLATGQPDDISIAAVQTFGFDRDEGEEAAE